MKLISIITLTIFTIFCNLSKKEVRTNKVDDSVTKDTATQIGTYVISAFEDSKTGMIKDRHGMMWLAGAGGLYKINQKEEIINVTTKGPWK